MGEDGLAIVRPRASGEDRGVGVGVGVGVGADRALEHAIAVNTRAVRTERGMSITALAAQTGISKAMLSKIENAQTSPSLSTLSRLAAGLGVPASSLLELAEPEDESLGELISMLGEVIRRLGGSDRS